MGLFSLALLLVCSLQHLEVQATTYSTGISYSEDGQAYTTDAGIKDTEFYRRGEKVYITEQAGLPALNKGQHYFSYERTGEIPVYFWEVVHPYGKCIHDDYPMESTFHGVSFGKKKCGANYFSGWNAYCKDCKEKIVDFLIYMSKDTATSFAEVDVDKEYYYLCPTCNNLEQARGFGVHRCKAISANRYFITYNANGGEGYMTEDMFLYDNAEEYEFQSVEAAKALRQNRFSREGYYFTGWNTKADGTGRAFEQEEEIINLTEINDLHIVLYAQWRKGKNKVIIDTGEGTYGGEKNPSFVGEYQEEFTFQKEKVIAPKGYLVKFETGGGQRLQSLRSQFVFDTVIEGDSIKGKWNDPVYIFSGVEEIEDVLEVIYQEEGILLPTPQKEGYSFCGWFLDSEGTQYVGKTGDTFCPAKDVMLYAKWAELALVSTENKTAYSGSGAVDLSWQQADEKEKNYRIFQRKEGEEFLQISTDTDRLIQKDMYRKYTYSEKVQSFFVSQSGRYVITLYGSQGEELKIEQDGICSVTQGGKGGEITASFYLEQGDQLTILLGGKQNDTKSAKGQGGIGTLFGSGGGYSMVSSKKEGILLVAGGGGGAGYYEDGKAGGTKVENIGDMAGGDGGSGGGGGSVGGTAGNGAIHTHTLECEHIHVGSPEEQGGCYTKAHICEANVFIRKVLREGMYYGNVDVDGNLIFCVRCNSYDCKGHTYSVCEYTCANCGHVYSVQPQTCTQITGYEPGCGLEEGYLCGYVEGQILYSTPGYGGSSYVNRDKCLSYENHPGTNSGQGRCIIEGKGLGSYAGNTLPNVKATDEAVPGKIENYTAVNIWNQQVRVTIQRPQDRGTTYEHQVVSYSVEEDIPICESNITVDTIVSGIKGYRYRIDHAATGELSDQDAFCDSKDEKCVLTVSMKEGNILHIAAQDRAGNIGEAIHLEAKDILEVLGDVKTTPIVVTEGENVYRKSEREYFVRADGTTSFEVNFSGYLCGEAKADYQVHTLTLTERKDETEQVISFGGRELVSYRKDYRYPIKEIDILFSGDGSIKDTSGIILCRESSGQVLRLKKCLLMPMEMNGERVQLLPGASAGRKEMKSSLPEENEENGIWLIGDGEAPILQGLEILESLPKEKVEGNTEVCLQAIDSGSGLQEFYVEIANQEKDLVRRITAGEDGKLSFSVDEKDALYQGRFTILCYTSDRVGNMTTWVSTGLGMSINAYLERILPPHTPVFRRGESGRITVVTTGYVERVEIIFPQEMLQWDPSLNHEILFLPPLAYTENEVEFMIPQEVPDGEYEIIVTGYKAGTDLENHSESLTLRVRGSVAELIRTRLR